MRRFVILIFALAASLTAPMASAASADPVVTDPDTVAGSLVVLSYHEARDEVRDYPDPYAVDTAALVRQFSWLRGNGYTPVSVDTIIKARQGGPALPAKAVLLTFDDAYLSFYTRVYPVLREFGFPAVLGVVGRWIDQPPGGSALYGEKESVPDASFPSWSQLREMARSGLVEIASHTYDLHHGVPANPQGNVQPAATARIHDAATGRFEDDAHWRARVQADLARNTAVIKREIGIRPRVVVWPYGSYNEELIGMAGALGMPIALTLDDGINTPDIPLTALRRILIEHNPSLAEFSREVRGPRYAEPLRIVQVSLDQVYSADSVQQERNLSLLLDRIEVLKPTFVFLQATADPNADGIASAAYFPNRHLPLRGDLFNRAAWQLASRVDVKVFAVMPVTGFHLSPIQIAEVYEDLARHASFDGLVFADQIPPTDLDTAAVLDFTDQLTKRVRAFRVPMLTVRSMRVDELPALTPDGSATQESARRFALFAAAYDYVALLSRDDSTAGFDPWLKPIQSAQPRPPNQDIRRKLLFMVQNTQPPASDLAGSQVVRQMRALQLGGAINFGYFPDDFLHDNPPLAQIAPAMSLRVNPLAQRDQE